MAEPPKAGIGIAPFDRWFRHLLWELDPAALSRPAAAGIRAFRIVVAVVRDLAEGQIGLRAMSLVYTTLLSLVPLLAISFSVLKGFGVHNQIEPALAGLLEPLGPQGAEIKDRIIQFVENVNVGVLGSLGLGLLLYTVVSLMQKIERAFNYTWRVNELRPFAQRFSGYLTVILIGPLLIFSALGIKATVMSLDIVSAMSAVEPMATLISWAGALLPYLLVIGAFTFIYVFMPNAPVRLLSAFAGGVIAGALWESVGWAFTAFLVSSPKYTAIYSAFAGLVLFLIWLYVSWLILLVGASIAYYHQNPARTMLPHDAAGLSIRIQERLALAISHLIARHYQLGLAPWTADALAHRFGGASSEVPEILDRLESASLITRTGASPPAFIPARATETIPLDDVLAAVREAGEEPPMAVDILGGDLAVDPLCERLDSVRHAALEGLSLRDLGLSEEAPQEIRHPAESVTPALAAGRD